MTSKQKTPRKSVVPWQASDVASPEKPSVRVTQLIRRSVPAIAEPEDRASPGDPDDSGLWLEVGPVGPVRVGLDRGFDRASLAAVLEVLRGGGYR